MVGYETLGKKSSGMPVYAITPSTISANMIMLMKTGFRIEMSQGRMLLLRQRNRGKHAGPQIGRGVAGGPHGDLHGTCRIVKGRRDLRNLAVEAAVRVRVHTDG